MRNRIAIAALSALIGAGSLLGALAKPALADAADHHRAYHHHHAYQNPGRHLGWNNGRHVGWNNADRSGWNYGQYARYTGYGNANQSGSWVNGKYYPNGYTGGTWNGNQNGWNRRNDGDHDRDDRNRRHHHHHHDRR